MSAEHIHASTTSTSSTSASAASVESAAKDSRNWNIAAMLWVVFAGLIGAALAYMAWRAGNRANDLAMEDANARIAEAQAVAAQAQLETEEIRRDTATIQRSMRRRNIPDPRSVGDPAVKAKYSALNEFAGKRVVIRVAPDLEAQEFAASLWRIFKAANWKPETPRGILERRGVAVYSGDEPGTLDWRAGAAVADLISAVFEMSGIGGEPIVNMPETLLPVSQMFERPPGAMMIVIGQREVLAAQSEKQK